MAPAGFERATQQASGRRPTPRPLGHWDRHNLQMLRLMLEYEVLSLSTRWHETEGNDCVNVGAGDIMDVSICCRPRNERNLSAQNCGAESPRSVSW